MASLSNPLTVTFPISRISVLPGSTSYFSGSFNRTFTRSRQGGSNPKWKAMIRRGENATTNFSGTLQFLNHETPGEFTLSEFNTVTGALVQKITSYGQIAMEFGGASDLSVSANNQALKFLYRAIKEKRTSFQGGVFLGEMREALRMLTSPAKALRQGLNNYFTDVRKRAKGNIKAKNRITAETWLEYSFGWTPLVSDINSAVKAYVRHTEKVLTNRVTRVGAESSVTIHQANAAGGNHLTVPILTDRKVISTTSVMYRVGLRFAGQGSSPDVSVFERAGLTLSEFIPTVWELIPYSFLVDYFTNIGDIIEAGATNTSDVIWVNKTVRSQAIFQRHDKPDSTAGFVNPVGNTRVIYGKPGSFETTNRTVSRTIPVLGFPRFSVSIPGNPIQWINMAALAATSRKVSNFLS